MRQRYLPPDRALQFLGRNYGFPSGRISATHQIFFHDRAFLVTRWNGICVAAISNADRYGAHGRSVGVRMDGLLSRVYRKPPVRPYPTQCRNTHTGRLLPIGGARMRSGSRRQKPDTSYPQLRREGRDYYLRMGSAVQSVFAYSVVLNRLAVWTDCGVAHVCVHWAATHPRGESGYFMGGGGHIALLDEEITMAQCEWVGLYVTFADRLKSTLRVTALQRQREVALAECPTWPKPENPPNR